VIRNPDFAALGKVESRRHYADNGQLKLARLDRFADDVRIALEHSAIKRIADYRHQRAAFLVGIVVQAAKLGLHAKDAKEMRIGDRAIDLGSYIVGKNAVRVRSVVGEGLETVALGLPIEEVGQGNLSDAPGAWPERPHRNDALRILIRKRTQHHRID